MADAASVGSTWSEDSFGVDARAGTESKAEDIQGSLDYRIGDETDDKGKLLVYRKGVHHSALGTYKGEFVNSRKHGQGSFHYANGDVYVGEWRYNLYDGYGVLTHAAHRDAGRLLVGKSYRGTWVAGKKAGRGVLDLGDGSAYDGEFANNRYHGKGTMRFADGGEFTGDWEAGRMSGRGSWTYANGDRYEGELRAGLFHGTGVYVYHAGGLYNGEWKAGMPHGQGKRVFSGGASYHGSFVDGKMHGDGVFKNETGDVYTGFLVNNLFEGEGVIVCVNGDRYEGEWKRGRYCGRGKSTYAFGGHYEGQYMAMARAGATGRRGRFAKRAATIHALTAADAAAADEESGGPLYALADGKKHGYGKRVWSSGAEYDGEWGDDTMHGYGVYHSPQMPDHAFTYEGMFVKGKFHGKGKATYGTSAMKTYVCPNGHRHKSGMTCKYEGSWARGFQHGNGRMVCCDGRYYHGNFRFGKPHGYGVKLFIPEAERGYKEKLGMGGDGSLYRAETYHGDFWEGQREGAGTLTYGNGDVHTGLFENGKLHGKVKITFASGRTVGAVYEHGVRVKWTPPEDTSAERALKLLMKFRDPTLPEKAAAARK